jgi:AraC-like DNA-binding protein
MIRSRTLASTPLVALARFDHPAGHAHHDPKEESAAAYSLNFVERGCFELRTVRRQRAVSRGDIFLTHPGMTYRCRHASERPDDVCVSVAFAETVVEDAWRIAGRGPGWQEGVAPSSNRLEYLRERLLRAAAADSGPLALEGTAAELLAATGSGGGKLFRCGQLRWYTERVDAARDLLNREYAERHTLETLSRRVGMSAFHFARVFRELAGAPPHRYLLGVRLERAAERLRKGAAVTETCYAVGFSNLSHFIRSFRRTFGVSPSRFR